ncbi:MAG: EscU/YscU/HrcU family type III secretion system export apparatus switch protein [Janthinobacterium lividum]
MMAEQDLDRNAAATPYKLQKAREKGRVAKSQDAVAAIVFACAATYLAARGWDDASAFLKLLQRLLQQALQSGQHGGPGGLFAWPLIAGSIKAVLGLLAPLLLSLALAAIAGSLCQTGPLLAFVLLKPDLDRINPVNGLRKLFSLRTLFESARTCLKLVLLALVCWHALMALLPQFHRLAFLAPLALARTLVDDMAALALKCALAMGLIALLDVAWNRRVFARSMRMSQRDLRDETRHREGDPRVRARLRELRNDMRRRSKAVQKTRNATVVLVNPVHLAVALRYVHGEMPAPVMLAKGAGQLARRMRDIAARHAIPVVQNAPLARQLFRAMEENQPLPQDCYAEVARILVWLLAQRAADVGKPGSSQFDLDGHRHQHQHQHWHDRSSYQFAPVAGNADASHLDAGQPAAGQP